MKFPAQSRLWTRTADDGKRFVVRADEMLTAFLELERAVCIHVLTQQFSELKIADEKLTAFLELERMINAM